MLKHAKSKKEKRPTKPSWINMRWQTAMILASVGIIIGLFATLIAQQPDDTAKPRGEFVSSSAASMRVTEIKKVDARELFSGKVIEGETGLIISISVENKSSQTQPFLPVNQFFLKGSSGEIYQMRPVAGVPSPIKGGNLAAGAVIAGDVSFMIDTDVQQVWLYFDPRWEATTPLVTHIL